MQLLQELLEPCAVKLWATIIRVHFWARISRLERCMCIQFSLKNSSGASLRERGNAHVSILKIVDTFLFGCRWLPPGDRKTQEDWVASFAYKCLKFAFYCEPPITGIFRGLSGALGLRPNPLPLSAVATQCGIFRAALWRIITGSALTQFIATTVESSWLSALIESGITYDAKASHWSISNWHLGDVSAFDLIVGSFAALHLDTDESTEWCKEVWLKICSHSHRETAERSQYK